MTWAKGKNTGPQGQSNRVQVPNTESLHTFSFTMDTDEVSGVTWNGEKRHAIVDSTYKLSDSQGNTVMRQYRL